MKLKIFSVYDAKAEAYMTPFFLQTKGQAIRGFMDLVSDKNTNVAKYPEDFTLFELGEYDDGRGSFVSHQTPISLGTALELKKE